MCVVPSGTFECSTSTNRDTLCNGCTGQSYVATYPIETADGSSIILLTAPAVLYTRHSIQDYVQFTSQRTLLSHILAVCISHPAVEAFPPRHYISLSIRFTRSRPSTTKCRFGFKLARLKSPRSKGSGQSTIEISTSLRISVA